MDLDSYFKLFWHYNFIKYNCNKFLIDLSFNQACKNIGTYATYPMYKPYIPKFNYHGSNLFKAEPVQFKMRAYQPGYIFKIEYFGNPGA